MSLAMTLRVLLVHAAGERRTLRYDDLATKAAIDPPHRIHRLTETLEALMAEDAAEGVPFLAALAISRARGGLPAPGFFATASRLGRYQGAETGDQARAYHAEELARCFAHWGATG